MSLASETIKIGFPKIRQEIVICRLRLRPTQPKENFRRPVKESHPWILLVDRIKLLPRDRAIRAPIRPVKFDVNAHVARRHLRLLVHGYRRRRVKSDGVKDELQATRLPPRLDLALEEGACGDSSVNLEALVLGDQLAGAVPAEIVEEGADGMDLAVGIPEARKLVGDDGAKEPGAHDVVVDEVGRVRPRKGERCVDGWCVGDGDAGEDARGEGWVGYVGARKSEGCGGTHEE